VPLASVLVESKEPERLTIGTEAMNLVRRTNMTDERTATARHVRPRAMIEGFKVASIYSTVAIPIVLLTSIWQAGGPRQFYSQADLAAFFGSALGLLISFGLFLAGLIALRNRSNVTKQALSDWRFWLAALFVAVVFSTFPQKPVLGWLWCCLIYSYRDRRRTRAVADIVAVVP
jgi:hypothetical protein